MAEGDPKIGKKDIYRGDLIVLSSPDDPTPTLYHYDGSYYSQVCINLKLNFNEVHDL